MSVEGKQEHANWTLDDLIAFECGVAFDEREDWATLREKDEALGLESPIRAEGTRRELAKHWLTKKSMREPEVKLAAESVGQSLKVAGQLFGVLGLLSGLGLATTALAYTGRQPINVSDFFGVFVMLQALWAAVLLLVFLLPARWREACAFGPLFRTGRWALSSIFSRTQALASRFLSGQQRTRAAEVAGAARRSLALHGVTAKWVAFTKIQAAALLFNLGALVALLVAVAFSDRAFGWQTTLEVSNESIQSLVETVALPWSWWQGEGVGYPNYEQIEGSRIVLKDGIQELQTRDLAAWWKFLALGIVFYGLLPRLLFYALGKLQTRASLAKYDFRDAAAERLIQRLRPSRSGFDAEAIAQGSEQEAATADALADADSRSLQRVRCLCSQELSSLVDPRSLSIALAERWGLPEDALEIVYYTDGRMSDMPKGFGDGAQLAIVFESWMPPIKEVERQVKALRSVVDERCLVKLVLLGIPASDSDAVSLRPEAQYAEAWHSFVRRLGDPYLILDNLTV